MTGNDYPPVHRVSRAKGDLFRLKGISVLHLDDEEEFLEMTRVYIDSFNRETRDQVPVRIDSSTDPVEVLERLQENDHDVLITDYKMPVLDGLQVLEAVRKQSAIPVIILTGRGKEEVIIQALDLGADYYIRKSSDHESLFRELLLVIRTLARNKRTGEALKTSMRLLKLLFEESPACNLVIRTDGTVENMNGTLLKLLGYSRQEMTGKPFLDFVDHGERERARRQVTKALNGVKRPDSVFTLLTKNSRQVKLLFSGKQVLFSTGVLVTAIPLDHALRKE
ncbi:MAG: response regulator [Candidatus Odinarchaeota archaeon]